MTEINIQVKINRFRRTLNLLDQSKYRLNAKYDSRISDKVEWTLTFIKAQDEQYKHIHQLNLLV